jgi:hypothetical protein
MVGPLRDADERSRAGAQSQEVYRDRRWYEQPFYGIRVTRRLASKFS